MGVRIYICPRAADLEEQMNPLRSLIATLGMRGISASWVTAANVIQTFVRFSLPSPAVTLPSDDPSLNIASPVGV